MISSKYASTVMYMTGKEAVIKAVELMGEDAFTTEIAWIAAWLATRTTKARIYTVEFATPYLAIVRCVKQLGYEADTTQAIINDVFAAVTEWEYSQH